MKRRQKAKKEPKVSGSTHPLAVFLRSRKILLLFIDVFVFLTVYAVALGIGLSSHVLDTSFPFLQNVLIFLSLIVGMRVLFRVYSNIWRYASASTYILIVLSDLTAGILSLLILRLAGFSIGVWTEVAIVAVSTLATLSCRFFYQVIYRHLNLKSAAGQGPLNAHRVMIVGAGQVGSMLAMELLMDGKGEYKPVGFFDTDRDKVGSYVHGLRVYAEGENYAQILRELEVEEVFLALPSLESAALEQLYQKYSATGCKVKLYDYPLRDPEGSSGAGEGENRRRVREVRIEDLLFRQTLDVMDEQTQAYYRDRVVLVTGGGGSIGSELCRQVARCRPRRLILLDIYENNAYEIEQELRRQYGGELDLCVEIASVRDRARLEAVFRHYRPQIVFHAAAHKHVPLMEHSGGEAVKNNVFGTVNTADMAEKYGAEKFILISTDKAVNPTNIMGATKRLCEMVILCRSDSPTAFSAVRFGNVLDSNGSVIPLFRRQIEAGGPVTLTDRRIVRYFMTIPEASGLVMTAGALAKRGELFVLDMGRPVRILDLAENMIRLSGLKPYEDIQIKEIGLRPGEKLYEELLGKKETLRATEHRKIFIETDEPHSRADVESRLERLRKALSEEGDSVGSEEIRRVMMEVVPSYRRPEEVNAKALQSEEMRRAQR